jgi:drug/metabolite transporter (DMT)-like permease
MGLGRSPGRRGAPVFHSRVLGGSGDVADRRARIRGSSLGYSGETWFWLAAITAGPQLMGHTVFNWALRYVQASIISGTILAEPVGAARLTWLVLSERPGLLTIVGGAVVLVCV